MRDGVGARSASCGARQTQSTQKSYLCVCEHAEDMVVRVGVGLAAGCGSCFTVPRTGNDSQNNLLFNLFIQSVAGIKKPRH
eukprot:2704092-Prymnesium_polylepis.1